MPEDTFLSPEAFSILSEASSVLRSERPSDLESFGGRVDGFPTGRSPERCPWIMAAVDVGSLVAIQWMLSKRVNLAVIDIDGTTVLLAALWREKADRLRVLELLLEHGAPVNLPGIYGMTPAHLAALNNDVDALRILIAHGADLTLKDCDGTPLDAAESRHAEAAAELIRRALDEGRGSEHS